MKKRTYSEKLRDPRWERRLEILSNCEFKCVCCASNDKELHVHHLLYERGRDPWDYEDKLLLPLCVDCHDEIDRCQKDITRRLADYPPDFLFDLLTALRAISNTPNHPWEVWSRWIESAEKKRFRRAS